MSFGGTIKLKGETEYKAALKNVNAALKESASELKLVESSYDSNDRSMEKYQAKSKVLNDSIATQSEKVNLLKSRLEEATAAYGTTDNRTIALKTSYNKAQTELNQLNTELNKNQSEMQQSATATTQAATATDKFAAESDKVKSPLSGIKGQLKGLAAGAVAAFSINGIVNFSKASIEAYKNAEQQQKKLDVIMTERLKATKEDIQSVKDLTAEQSRNGVVGKTAQIQGAQQLGTFVKQTSSLKQLIPAMNDLAVQQHGVNTTGKDMQNIGNLMGKVFTGQTGALKRVGISFTEAQEKVLKYGTETEKAAMLSQVITDNVGHMNKEMAKTDAGKIQNAKNQIAGLKVTLGADLLPIVSASMGVFSKLINIVIDGINKAKASFEAFKNSKIGESIMASIQQIISVVGPALTYAHNLIKKTFDTGSAKAFFSAVGKAADAILKFVAMIVKSQAAAVIAKGIFIGVIGTIKAAVIAVKTVTVAAIQIVTGVIKGVIAIVTTAKSAFTTALHSISTGFSTVLTAAKNLVSGIKNGFANLPSYMKSIGSNIVKGLWNGINGMVSWVITKIKGFGKSIVDSLKDFLGIHSPSTVMAEIGKYMVQGLSKGISDNQSVAAKSVALFWDNLADVIAAKQKQLTTVTDKLKTITNGMTASQKAHYDKLKAQADKATGDSKKTLTAKAEAYEDHAKTMTAKYKANLTSQKESLTAEIKNLSDYEKQYEEHLKEIDSRSKELAGSFSLFEAVTPSEDTSTGSQLTSNLQSQVDALSSWMDNLQTLKDRGVTSALLSELQSMGPSMAQQIQALTTMTDTELKKYTDLYNQKVALAKTEAEKELGKYPSVVINVEDSEATIKRNRAKITSTVKTVVGALSSDLLANKANVTKASEILADENIAAINKNQYKYGYIGRQMVQGLITGMESQRAALAAEAEALAEVASNATAKKAGVHSPSTVFAQIGSYMAQGLSLGFAQQMQSVNSDIANAISIPDARQANLAASVVNGLNTVLSGQQGQPVTLVLKLDSKEIARGVYDPLRSVGTQRGVALNVGQ